MTHAILAGFKEASWGTMVELEDNLALAADYLSHRDRGLVDAKDLEKDARRGLRRCVGKLQENIKYYQTRLRELGPKLQKLTVEVRSLKSEASCALRSMAASQLKRVGGPKVDLHDVSEDLMMAVVEVGASADAFNALYEALPAGLYPEWVCTEEATKWPEQDLLGMCPGGKPHLNEEQLKASKAKCCYCSICIPRRRLDEKTRLIEEIKPEVEQRRAELKQDRQYLREAKWTIRRLRAGSDDQEQDLGDPVFLDDDQPFESDDSVAFSNHARAQMTWDTVQDTLSVTDFPLRVVFLDKSASMGCDRVTYDALQLGINNCMNPLDGSTLSFLFAGPGHTQIFFRRPGDEPIQVEVELGCATWFNEPILRTLKFLAPVVEKLNTKGWIEAFGQPPLQVLCLTDGADNCSPNEIRSLAGLVRELREIVGPVSGEKLYAPITGSVKKHKEFLDEANGQVPVWLAWICCGTGGSSLLDSKIPKGICMIDAIAVPQCREPPAVKDIQEAQLTGQDDDFSDAHSPQALHALSSTVASRARKRMSTGSVSATSEASWANASWSIGHRVRVRATAPGKAPKAAMVLHILEAEGQPPQYEVLYDDESRDTVNASQLLGAPPKQETLLRLAKNAAKPKGVNAQQGLLARAAEPDAQRTQVLQVVDSVMQNLAKVMHSKSEKSKIVSLEDASRFVGDGKGIDVAGLEAKVKATEAMCEVASQEQVPPADPTDMLLMAIGELSRGAAKLLPEDRVVAQRIVSVGMELLVCGGSVMPMHVSDQLGPFARLSEANAVRRLRIEPGQMDTWRQELSQSVQDLLNMLMKKGLLESAQTSDGEVWSAAQDALPCLAAIWRFVDPSLSCTGHEDSLRRAVNRTQRLKPSFSFCSPSGVQNSGIMTDNSTRMPVEEDPGSPQTRRSRDGLPPLCPSSPVSTPGSEDSLPPLCFSSRVSTPRSASKGSPSGRKLENQGSQDMTSTTTSLGSNRSSSTTASGSSSPLSFIRKSTGSIRNRTSSLTALGGRMLCEDERLVSLPGGRPGSAKRCRTPSRMSM